jgi:hypothetical protein
VNFFLNFGMCCSSVSIVTRLGDVQPTNHGSIPGSDKDVTLVHSVQTASGVHPFCPVEVGTLSSEYGWGCGVQVDILWRFSYTGGGVRMGPN